MKNISIAPSGLKIPESVNYHLLSACNFRCKFCFATFAGVHSKLTLADRLQITRDLSLNFQKITFVGGEPMLYPELPKLIEAAKELGAITCLVTNGSLLTPDLIRDLPLDWITLSIDSANPLTHKELGRAGKGKPPLTNKYYLDIAQCIRQNHRHLKVNTVVTKLNYREDMSDFIREIGPERWKIFQVLPIKGENDKWIDELRISKEEFAEFVDRHHSKLASSGVQMVPEDNELMSGSYAMVDPLGRFFDDVDGDMHYGERSILEVGIEAAWADVRFNRLKFEKRGGADYFK